MWFGVTLHSTLNSTLTIQLYINRMCLDQKQNDYYTENEMALNKHIRLHKKLKDYSIEI